MNIVVLLFLQCGTNHRDCFQSAYCESSIGHSAGYESEALFYHSAKDRASASVWMLLCVIIQQRTARTSVLIYLLILFVPRMTHEALQLKNPLTTVASNNLCPSQILQCHSSFSFFFSGALWASSGALWASSRFSRSTWAQIRTVLIFYLLSLWRQGLFISNASLCLFLIVGSLLFFHIVVYLISCLATVLQDSLRAFSMERLKLLIFFGGSPEFRAVK